MEEALADGLTEAEADPEVEALGLMEADGLTEADAIRERLYSFTNSTNDRVISLTVLE